MNSEKTLYTERSPWPGFVSAIYWGAIVSASYPLLAGGDTELPFATRFLVVGGIFGVATALRAVLGGLTVRVQETRLWIHLGSVPLIKKVVAFSEIESLESVEYQPIREFGGWGVRGFGKRKAWTARGNRAVGLRLQGGRELLVGSDHPQRLEERIRAASGLH